MGKIHTYRRGLSAFIASENGQRFFNFAYSIGAAVVILGALFKILHLTGGNTLLSIGMGTEVLMFILTAFDRPPREYNWEEVFPALKGKDEAASPFIAQALSSTPQALPGMELGPDDTRSLSESIAKMATAAEQLSSMSDLAAATQAYLSHMEAIAGDMQQLHTTTEALNKVSAVLLESYNAITDNSANISESSRGYVEQMKA